MRIGLSGGVFGSPMGSLAASAPENVLLRFLREQGHVVETWSASSPAPDVDVDVVHSHHFGVAAYDNVFSGRRPFVFTSHNPFLATAAPFRESRLEHALQRLVLRSADAVVALAGREADMLSSRFGVPRERFVVIPNGLDLALYAEVDESPPEHDQFELLAVGQLLDYKGHRFLLDALGRLGSESGAIRLRIVTHQDTLRRELVAQAKTLGLEHVEFEGPLTTTELVERYRRCDIFVQPSLAECFPVTVLEAMACGKPVIATDVGGVTEEVGEGGIIVPPGDAAALAAAIHRLAASPDERRRRGEEALRLARARYDGREIAERLAHLYADLFARAKPRSPSPFRRTASRAALGAYGRRGRIATALPARVRVR